MKKACALVLALVMVFALCAGASAAEPEYVWKMALNSSEGDNAYDMGAAFAEKINELTDGRVQVDLYGGAALGSTSEVLEGMSYGVADCMVESVSILASFSDKANIDVMPYMYSGFEHWEAVWRGELGEQIKEEVGEESGFQLLGATYRNPRIVTATYEMKDVEDFAGFKIRVPNQPAYIETWNWLKAAPQPLAMNEVYTALQQKTVDGQENPIQDCKNYAFDEVCDYWIKTNHAYGTNIVIFSRDYFAGLPEDIQEACIEAADYASEVVTGAALDKAAETEEALIAEGKTVIEVDIPAFIEYFDGFCEEKFPDLADWANQIKALDPTA